MTIKQSCKSAGTLLACLKKARYNLFIIAPGYASEVLLLIVVGLALWIA